MTTLEAPGHETSNRDKVGIQHDERRDQRCDQEDAKLRSRHSKLLLMKSSECLLSSSIVPARSNLALTVTLLLPVKWNAVDPRWRS
jgi:hypothetical protein